MGWPLCLGKAQHQQGGEQKGVAVLPEAGEQIVQGLQHPGEPPGRKSAFAARCRPDEFRRQQLPQLGADLQKVVPFAADRFHSGQQLVFAALAEQGEQLASQLGMLLQAAIRQKGQGGADGVGSFRRPAKLLLGSVGAALTQHRQDLLRGERLQPEGLHPGENGGQEHGAVFCREDKHGVFRRLLQDLEQGVLGLIGHILGAAQHTHPAGGFAGEQPGILPQLADGIDVEAAPAAIAAVILHIGVVLLQHLAALGTDPTGLFLAPAEQRCGDLPGKGAPAAARRPLQQQGMRKTPAVHKGGERFLSSCVITEPGLQTQIPRSGLQLFKAFHIQNKDGGTAYGYFHRERGVHTYAVGSGRGYHLGALLAVFTDDGDGQIHLFVLCTTDQGGVSAHEETTGGSQLGDGETILGQLGLDLIGVIIGNDCNNKFHNICLP